MAENGRGSTAYQTVHVDRVACSGHGVCAQVLLGTVRLDEWGYPVIANPRVDPETGAVAVKMCPAQALWLT